MSQKPATLFDPKPHHVPPGTGAFGMWLFLAALAMLFLASLLGYLWMRFGFARAPDMGTLHLPWPLWVSTALILISSYTIHRALQNVRQERQDRFRNAMVVTFLLAIGFLLVQLPSLAAILNEHWPRLAEYSRTLQEVREEASAAGAVRVAPDDPRLAGKLPIEGAIFCLIALHALHILGGIVPMAVVTYHAQQGRYDHEHYAPVEQLAMYWHFLDAVWIVLFAMLLLTA